MIHNTTRSGEISIIDGDDNYYTVILNNYVGTVEPDSSVAYLKFHLYGSSTVTNDIALQEHDNLDYILVEGSGKVAFKSLKATNVELKSDIAVNQISGKVIRFLDAVITAANVEGNNVVPINESNLSSYSGLGETHIKATDHIWFLDTKYVSAGYSICVSSPFVLIKNSSINAIGDVVFDTSHEMSVEFCDVIEQSSGRYLSRGKVVEADGTPKPFTYNVTKPSKHEVNILDRRKLFGHIPMQPTILEPYTNITPYDRFKEYTGYTNVDLHVRVDQKAHVRDSFINLGLNKNDAVHDILKHVYVIRNCSIVPISDSVINKISLNIWDGTKSRGPELVKPIPSNVVKAIMNGTWDGRETEGSVPEDTEPISITFIDNLSHYRDEALIEYKHRLLYELTEPIPAIEIDSDIIKNVIYEVLDAYNYHDLSEFEISEFAIKIMNAIHSGRYNQFSGMLDYYNEFAVDEVTPRIYEEGIYSLYNYKTTLIEFHDENSRYDERP